MKCISDDGGSATQNPTIKTSGDDIDNKKPFCSFKLKSVCNKEVLSDDDTAVFCVMPPRRPSIVDLTC